MVNPIDKSGWKGFNDQLETAPTMTSLRNKNKASTLAIVGKVKWQVRFARRSKDSANRRKATKQIGNYDQKLADPRNDFALPVQ